MHIPHLLLYSYTQFYAISSTPHIGRKMSHFCTIYDKYSVIIEMGFRKYLHNVWKLDRHKEL